jgi:hypothetical protein
MSSPTIIQAIKDTSAAAAMIAGSGGLVSVLIVAMPDSLIPSPTLKWYVAVGCIIGSVAALLATPFYYTRKGWTRELRGKAAKRKFRYFILIFLVIVGLRLLLEDNVARLWFVFEWLLEQMIDFSLITNLVFCVLCGYMIFLITSAGIVLTLEKKRAAPKEQNAPKEKET